MRNILYGVCGIGLGHTYRQLPIIHHFAAKDRLMIFGYGKSYEVLSAQFRDHPQVDVQQVAVPYYVGNKEGLDFEATQKHPRNQGKDFALENAKAFSHAMRELGRPDLVVSDYEPMSAGYAYMWNAPFVTIDQQSKYLCGNFPKEIHGFGFEDEKMRLRMFFPQAQARIVCSFFDFPRERDGIVVPSVLRPEVLQMDRSRSQQKDLLVYFSSQQEIPQPLDSLLEICGSQNAHFHFFIDGKIPSVAPSHVTFYNHGDLRFDEVLRNCAGIITTAGHTLLSEAMHLGIPVYTIPLPVYEQHMNAKVISDHHFGVSHPVLAQKALDEFLLNLSSYEHTIKTDQTVLLRGPGQARIIDFLESLLSAI